MRYVVLGVGRQGLAAVYDLLRYGATTEILAGDVRFRDPTAIQATQHLLKKILPENPAEFRLQPLDLDNATERQQWVQAIRGFDVVLSALPWKYNLAAAELAMAAGLPMCDMGGNPHTVEQQKQLAETHHQIQVPECGLAPGIANIFLKYLHDRYDAVQVQAYCGGLPKSPPPPADNPLQYKLVFSPEGLISEYMGACPLLKDGQLRYEPALTGLEKFDDLHEAFYTSNNSPRIFEYLASCGVIDCTYKTLRYPGHLEKFRALVQLGFLQGSGNTDEELARRLAAAPTLQFDRSTDRDKVLLSVQGRSPAGVRTTIMLQEAMDEQLPFTAMEKTTCWGTTIVAEALARGQRPAGWFATPEQFIDGQWFIEQLQRRTSGLSIREISA